MGITTRRKTTKCTGIKQIHTFTSIILFEQGRFGLCYPGIYQIKKSERFGDHLLGSSPTKSQKKTIRVGGPQSAFSISSCFIFSFVLLPFFLNAKMNLPVQDGFQLTHFLCIIQGQLVGLLVWVPTYRKAQ